jgi:hypothetical protein
MLSGAAHPLARRGGYVFMKRMSKNWKIIVITLSVPVILLGSLGLWMVTTAKSLEQIRLSISGINDMDYGLTYAFRNDERSTFTFYVDTPGTISFSNWERNLWGYNEVIIQNDEGNTVARWEVRSNEQHSEFIEEGDYTLVVKFNHSFMGSCVVAVNFMTLKTPLLDTDLDGLPDKNEEEHRTDIAEQDTDADGLTDYEEIRKYLSNPLESDSDRDGIGDSNWNERREYTYSIQAIVDLRPFFTLEEMQDFYQDVRIIEELGDDVTRLEVILYPEAREFLNPAFFEPKNNQYTAPTFTKNYSTAMQNELGDLVKNASTDLAATLKILHYFRHKTRYIEIDNDLGYSTDLPLNFSMHLTSEGELIRKGLGEPSHTSMAEIERHVLFADSMFEYGTHGACGSTSTLRGAMLRSVGLEEKIIVTIPLLYFYENDGTEVKLKDQYWDEKFVSIPKDKTAGADHFFNMIKIGVRWIRVDYAIMNGANIYNRNSLYIKIVEQHEILEDDFTEYWSDETWREKRPYKYVSIIEQEAQHSIGYQN